ncbi:MAG: glucose/galactose MFS transporter [Marinilabiliaceae bacterium]|nr:glucose/galactose MFS transporter [Marinilabiliaceae bacterium]
MNKYNNTGSTINLKGMVLPMFFLGIMFFVTGFGVGISGVLIPFLQDAFSLSIAESYLVTAAIFSAFVIFGVPSGIITKKVGYKNAMIQAFFIMALGMYLFIPSAQQESFTLFLAALFIGGIGNTLLQTAINPYITIIGPKESAAMRISLMGIMNKLAWWLGPIFLGFFLDMNNVHLSDIVTPFYLVTGVLCLLGIFIYFAPLPDISRLERENVNRSVAKNTSNSSIWNYPHLILGVIALFLYVGAETLPMASVIDFARMAFPDMDDYTSFAKYFPIGLVAGYLFGVVMIPKWLSQTRALIIFSFLGLFFTTFLCLLPGYLAIYSFLGLGFANSLMWPAIWPLAIDGLGDRTKKGASLLVMGIVGGAVLPFIFGLVVDFVSIDNQIKLIDYQHAYWILVPSYLFILFFAFRGHKIRKKI